jgi:spore coat polysaccharide biosynthesis protein SpsF
VNYNKKCGIIIQARRQSTRFPNKVVKKIMSKPMLFHIIRRVQQAKNADSVIVATTSEDIDRALENITRAAGIDIFFGNTNDVLDRYYQAARKFELSEIVRISADSPLIDGGLVDCMISYFESNKYDFISNSLKHTFPEGMSIEIFSFRSLEIAWKESIWASEREHVTPYIWKNNKKFNIGEFLNSNGNESGIRLTVDFPEDLILVRQIYKGLFPIQPYFGLSETLDFLKKYPHLIEINNTTEKYQGYKKSIINDYKIK